MQNWPLQAASDSVKLLIPWSRHEGSGTDRLRAPSPIHTHPSVTRVIVCAGAVSPPKKAFRAPLVRRSGFEIPEIWLAQLLMPLLEAPASIVTTVPDV